METYRSHSRGTATTLADADPELGTPETTSEDLGYASLRFPSSPPPSSLALKVPDRQSLEACETTGRILDKIREDTLTEAGAEYITRVLDTIPVHDLLSRDLATSRAVDVALFHHLYVLPLEEKSDETERSACLTGLRPSTVIFSEVAASIVGTSPSGAAGHCTSSVTLTHLLEKILLDNDPLFSSRFTRLITTLEAGPDAPSLATWGTYQTRVSDAVARVRELLPCTAALRYQGLLGR